MAIVPHPSQPHPSQKSAQQATNGVPVHRYGSLTPHTLFSFSLSLCFFLPRWVQLIIPHNTEAFVRLPVCRKLIQE